MINSTQRAEADSVSHEPVYVSMAVSEIAAGDRRLDAEVFLSEGYVVRREIQRSSLKARQLGELARLWQPSRLKGIQVEPQYGVPFLAATQVFDIWPTPRKWLAPSKTPADLFVKPDWILVTRSGTVGNTILSYSAHADIVISDDLLRVEVAEPGLRSYVYAFLRTRFGRAMLRGSHYGNVIKHLEVAHLAELPIPVLDHVVAENHEQVTGVLTAREEAHRLDRAARARFAMAMEDQPDLASEDGYTVAASRLFAGRRRLEANAYNPRSSFIAHVYERNASYVTTLGEISRVYLPGRFKRIYGESGTTYLDSEPIFKINPELTKILTPATNIDFDAYMVQRGWLLMARSGQTYGINGQAIIANDSHTGKVVTEHIIRLIPDFKRVRSGYLQTVLSHPALGQPLVVSQAHGTSVPELAPEDIEALPIPRLTCDVETEIADSAEEASELRMRADAWENEAVARLECELSKELGMTPDRRHHGLLQLSQVA